MARRQLDEINAGSMADIAFLLLIFFLVTTTMDTDEGIVRTMPQKFDEQINMEIELHARDVFEVLVNSNDQLLVENNFVGVEELRELTKEFLLNPEGRDDLPLLDKVTPEIAKVKIDSLSALLNSDTASVAFKNNSGLWKVQKTDWEDKLFAAEKVGPFNTLNKFSIISLRNDNGTSYEMYIKVQNEMQAAIDEIRNELALKHFGEKFTDWDPSKDADMEKIRIIRTMMPQRIAEQEPKNIQPF